MCRETAGGNLMVTIFGDFCQLPKKYPFFLNYLCTMYVIVFFPK
jgi:hypothetical protein